MPNLDELASLDATAQAELIRHKDVKPEELVEATIERIERVNPKLNAVIGKMYDQARTAAGGPLSEGPFAGVPFLLKDLTAAYGGVPMTAGSFFTREFVPSTDSELVSRLKRAGLIVVGKTNTPEFGFVPTTEPALFGATRNPWNTGRTTGGSSGGSAAAVAAGMVPMAHANDGGGSIRIPASCCGVFGLKPTRGRNPLGPSVGDVYGGLIAEHAITRTVRDSAALLDATCGPDIGDPYWAPPVSRPFVEEVGASPGRLRIAYSLAAPATTLHPDCVAAAEDAARLCEQLGHEIVEAALPIGGESLTHAFMTLWSAGCVWTIDGYARMLKKDVTRMEFEPGTWVLYEMGKRVTGADYLSAIQSLQLASRAVGRFFVDHDMWLTPTLGQPPVPLGWFDSTPEDPLQGMRRATDFVPFTPIFNATGQPAMSVPLFWNEEGLPIGAHFAGRFGDEATLFRLAAQLESARPWAHRKPPVSA